MTSDDGTVPIPQSSFSRAVIENISRITLVSRFYDWLRKFAPLFFPPIVVWSKIFAPPSRLIVHWRCVTSPGSLIGQKNFSQFSRLLVFLLALFDCCYSFCDTKLKKRSELIRLVMNVDKKNPSQNSADTLKIFKRGKLLKKLRCCVGGRI